MNLVAGVFRFIVGAFRFIVGGIVLVASCVAAMALLGLAVPQLDLLNHLQLLLFFSTLIGLVLILTLFGKRTSRTAFALIAVVGLVASGISFVPEWAASFGPRAPLPTDGRPVLKLMTHNLFGLNYDMQRVNAAIEAEDPDIIAFQEYFGEQAVDLHPLLKSRYPYFVRCKGGKRANIGLYSKIPFDRAMGESDCPDNAYGAQRTAHILAKFTLKDGTTFSVLTSHMDWPLPIARQQDELSELAKAINQIEGPLIVVGDFNSTPWSYALRRFGDETHLIRHTHNLLTYPLLFTVPNRLFSGGLVPLLPFLPLDHVFTRGDVAVQELHRGPATGSDHLPVIFSFSVTPVAKQLAATPTS